MQEKLEKLYRFSISVPTEKAQAVCDLLGRKGYGYTLMPPSIGYWEGQTEESSIIYSDILIKEWEPEAHAYNISDGFQEWIEKHLGEQEGYCTYWQICRAARMNRPKAARRIDQVSIELGQATIHPVPAMQRDIDWLSLSEGHREFLPSQNPETDRIERPYQSLFDVSEQDRQAFDCQDNLHQYQELDRRARVLRAVYLSARSNLPASACNAFWINTKKTQQQHVLDTLAWTAIVSRFTGLAKTRLSSPNHVYMTEYRRYLRYLSYYVKNTTDYEEEATKEATQAA